MKVALCNEDKREAYGDLNEDIDDVERSRVSNFQIKKGKGRKMLTMRVKGHK